MIKFLHFFLLTLFCSTAFSPWCYGDIQPLEKRIEITRTSFEEQLNYKHQLRSQRKEMESVLDYIKTAKISDYTMSHLAFVEYRNVNNNSSPYKAFLRIMIVAGKVDCKELIVSSGERVVDTILVEENDRKALEEPGGEMEVAVAAAINIRKWNSTTEIPAHFLSNEPLTARIRRLDGSLSKPCPIFRTDVEQERKRINAEREEERKRQGLPDFSKVEPSTETLQMIRDADAFKEVVQQTVLSTQTLSNVATPAEWQPLFDALASATQAGNKEKREEAFKKFLTLNPDKMPPEWRSKYYAERLQHYRLQDNWAGVWAIRQELMQKSRNGKTEFLSDVDTLLAIAACFSSDSFYSAPLVGDNAEAYERFKKDGRKPLYRYGGVTNASGVLEYVVKNFDENYASVVFAHLMFAQVQSDMNWYRESLNSYRKFESLVTSSKMYALPRFSNKAGGELMSADTALKEKKDVFQSAMEKLPEAMASSAARIEGGASDKSQAVKELRGLWKKYRNNEKARKKIEEALRELSTKTTEDIPAEEMGLPAVK